jgi:transcriptional regulator with XRE-family HTH domain
MDKKPALRANGRASRWVNPYYALREELGLTQLEFGQLMYIRRTRSRIAQLEAGGTALPASILLMIQKRHARALKKLGLQIEDFLGEGVR